MASFKYVICLDFEATCWEERDIDNAEIIGNNKIVFFFRNFLNYKILV